MKVSAIIPAYNAARWIEEAIVSIQRQTLPVHELIVVDDGSSDATGEIASRCGANLVTLSQNSGEGLARNAGLEQATGNVIAWLDADDMWAPHHVETLVDLFVRYPQADIACAAVQRFGQQTKRDNGYAPTDAPENIFWKAARDWLHPIIGTMMRREALEVIGGFSTEPRSSVDYDMWLRISRNHLFIGTHQVTSFWRWHLDQQSQNYGKQLADVYLFRRRFLDEMLTGQNPEDAKRFRNTMREMWTRNFKEALRDKDAKRCANILDARDLIPELDPGIAEKFKLALQDLNAVEI